MVSSIGNFPQLDVNNLYTNGMIISLIIHLHSDAIVDSTLNVTYGIFGGTWELFEYVSHLPKSKTKTKHIT